MLANRRSKQVGVSNVQSLFCRNQKYIQVLTHKTDNRTLLRCEIQTIVSESGALVKEDLEFGQGSIDRNAFPTTSSIFYHGMNTEARVIKCELTVCNGDEEVNSIEGIIQGFRF